MAEFNTRINAQRNILRVVNSKKRAEDLFGLSRKTIDRWILANQLDGASNLVCLVRNAADKLFFLANMSQEQVSDEYTLLTNEIIKIHDDIIRENKILSQGTVCGNALLAT